MNIPTFAITDTNTDPTQVDFAIPANDDATKSIALIVETMVKAIEEGLSERKMDKEAEKYREDEGTAEEAGMQVEYVGADDSEDDDSKPKKKTTEMKKPGATRKRTTTTKKASK